MLRTNRASRARRRRRKKRLPWLLLPLLCALAAIWYFVWIYPEQVDRATYQRKYVETIAARAAEYDLEEALVAAVIHCESRYQPEAVSGAGAMGLMQIMPETGEWIAGKLGDDFEAARLFDPDTNIRSGCWYLHYLLERFHGDLTKTVAAYHAGPNRVAEWMADPACSSDGETLAYIPIDATRRYVQNVLVAYKKYKELYQL